MASAEVFVQVLDVFDDDGGTGPVQRQSLQSPADGLGKPPFSVRRGMSTVFRHDQQVEVALIAVNHVAFDVAVVDPIAPRVGAEEKQHGEIVANQFADDVGNRGQLRGYVFGSLRKGGFHGRSWSPFVHWSSIPRPTACD